MSYIIDMHCHIVPGVDDGSQDIEESMALIEMEYDEGVRKIICILLIVIIFLQKRPQGLFVIKSRSLDE